MRELLKLRKRDWSKQTAYEPLPTIGKLYLETAHAHVEKLIRAILEGMR